MQTLYLKYPLNYRDIKNILEQNNYKTVTFFIDLQNIARGLYNKKTIELELSNYDENKQLYTLPYELFEYVKRLNNYYQKWDPFFIIYFDEGKSRYHNAIYSKYKSERKIAVIEDQILIDLFYKLKKFYFETIYETFNKYDNCIVLYLKEYESDFVPHYIIKKNYLDTKESTNLNILLTSDKDNLQTTKFKNTLQCITTYKKTKYYQRIYNSRNAISFIYSNFKPGILDASYIPLILSITGDKSDNIPGIKGYGPKKAIDFIIRYELNPDLSNISKVKDVIDIGVIERNYKLISFDYLIDHINRKPLEYIDKFFIE